MCVCLCFYMCVYVNVITCVWKLLHVCACVCTCFYIYVCLFRCLCVFVFRVMHACAQCMLQDCKTCNLWLPPHLPMEGCSKHIGKGAPSNLHADRGALIMAPKKQHTTVGDKYISPACRGARSCHSTHHCIQHHAPIHNANTMPPTKQHVCSYRNKLYATCK